MRRPAPRRPRHVWVQTIFTSTAKWPPFRKRREVRMRAKPLAVALLAMPLLIGMMGCGSSAIPNLKLSTAITAGKLGYVNGRDQVAMSITDEDTAIRDLLVYYGSGQDNWLAHHVVVDSGACVLKKSWGAFECGPLASGATMTLYFEGSPRDAGNFSFGFSYGDRRSRSTVRQTRYYDGFTEAVVKVNT